MAMNVTQLIWGQLSFILGVCGNVFVLYATIIHNAIKLDKMSTWIIKNLAVVDLCNCIFVIVPAIANQYSDGKWVFGWGTCYAYAVNVYTFIVSNAFLINVFSINKLMRCMYPLRNFNCTRFQRILVTFCTVIFGSSIVVGHIVPLSKNFYIVRKDEEETPLLTCTPGVSPTSYNTGIIIALSLVIVYDALPCLTLVITTTILMVYAIKKANRPINKINVLVVVSVTMSFLISFMPFTVFILTLFFPESIHKEHADKMFGWTWSFMFLSSWINPIIYLLMNESFRNFTKSTYNYLLNNYLYQQV